MAVNEIEVACPPGEVFAFLADGKRYAEWVVGAQNIRAVDSTWPEPGSKLHHTVGIGPLKVKDSTSVVEIDPGQCMVLEARFRPFGRARVEFRLRPEGDTATHVSMREEVLNAPDWVKRLMDPSIHARNAESLRRVRELLEPPPHP